MAKTFHKKNDGSTVVKDKGKIVTNLPSARNTVSSAPKVPLKNITRAKEYEQDYSKYYEAFQDKNIADGVASIDADIAHLDANIHAIRKELEENPESVYQVEDLPGLTLDTYHEEGEEISGKEAIDLYRLEKAVKREKRTEILIEQDSKDNINRIEAYSAEELGSSVVEGFHEPNTKEWLLARTQGIGGSDKIGYVDDSRKFVPFDAEDKKHYLYSVLAKKTESHKASIESGEDGPTEESQQALPLRIGNAMEKTIQYEFAVNHPEFVHYEDKTTRVANEGRTWHRFNPDGVLQDKETQEFGIFEAKTSRDKETFEKALPGYRAQCLHNASAAGLNFAVLVADIEGSNKQYVEKITYTEKELQDYRDAVDRVWLLYKPTYDRKKG
jgi:hypothetical protein